MGINSKLLIIVNWIPPYNKEINNVLAAPMNSTCRFRYQKKYVPTIENIDKLNQKYGTIVLRNRANGKFFPARNFQLWDANWIGGVLYLRVKLTEIAAISSNDDTSKKSIDNFNNLVESAIGSYKNTGDTDLRNLILFENGDVYNCLKLWRESSSENDIIHWGNVTKMIDENFETEDLDFIKIVALKNTSGEEVKNKAITAEKFGFLIKKNKSYKIDILQRTFTGKKGDSSLNKDKFLFYYSSNQSIEIPREKKPILGKYDLIQFDLNVGKNLNDSVLQTFLSITSNDEKYESPALEIPLLVKKSYVSIIFKSLGAFFFVVFLILYIWPSLLCNYDLTIEQSEKISVVGMILTSAVAGKLTKDIIERVSFG